MFERESGSQSRRVCQSRSGQRIYDPSSVIHTIVLRKVWNSETRSRNSRLSRAPRPAVLVAASLIAAPTGR